MTVPADHEARMVRALTSLQGVSVGDAFGQRFFGPPGSAPQMIQRRQPPPPRWHHTDDTEMTLSIVDVLDTHGGIDQDELAIAFARRHEEEPLRGYGAGARQILRAISRHVPWREAAAEPFGEAGSLGNGAAMRSTPIGAYFADDVARTIKEARASAEVTHLHAEGQDGAVAVALAAAYAAGAAGAAPALGLLSFVESHLAPGPIRLGVRQALAMPPGTSVAHAAAVLGSGDKVTAADTVPFCLWAATAHLDDYEQAIWTTVSALGDRDTTCAIVGGIVVLRAGLASIPDAWLASREGLPGRYRPDRASRA